MKLGKAACPHCKLIIGDIFVVDGKSYMFNGRWLIRDGTHNCPVCGKRFFWHGEHYDKQYHQVAESTGGSMVQ